MTRKECLDAAAACVLKDRQNQYGKPEDCFERIASLWSAYLNHAVHAHDVGAMMVLLKVARFKANPMHLDSAVDCVGYAACMAETATAWGEEQAEDRADRRFLDGVFGKYGGKCSGNYPENPDSSTEASAEPEFKCGDKVQARLGDGVWRDAEVTGKEITCGKLYYAVKVHDFSGYYSLQAGDVRSASAPKAEGCEELVQKDLHEDCEGCLYKTYADSHAEEYDAPRTPEETCQRIVDNNPATYERPCKPTGEELAEMAGEARIMWETRYEDNENA